jgi:Protein of unknown function (DUF2946)
MVKLRMPKRSTRRHLTSWLVCLAMMLSALAPTVSHALSRSMGKSVPWVEICTSMGIRMVQLESSEKDSLPTSSSKKNTHFDHCPFCLSPGQGVAILQSADLAWPVPARLLEAPSRSLSAPRQVFVWESARARGPPAARA